MYLLPVSLKMKNHTGLRIWPLPSSFRFVRSSPQASSSGLRIRKSRDIPSARAASYHKVNNAPARLKRRPHHSFISTPHCHTYRCAPSSHLQHHSHLSELLCYCLSVNSILHLRRPSLFRSLSSTVVAHHVLPRQSSKPHCADR